jgi:hypothetical protein
MKLETITKGIKEWGNSRKDLEKMKTLFKKGNCFKFKLPDSSKPIEDKFIHAYLAVLENEKGEDELKMLLIPRSCDHIKQENIQNEVKEGVLFFETIPVIKDKVDPKEARERIDNWVTQRDSWLKEQMGREKEIHQIFVMPKSYLHSETEYCAFFALNKDKTKPDDEKELLGDMIVWDQEKQEVTYPRDEGGSDDYFNTIHLVPPFRIEESQHPKENFYLLELANAIDS